MMGLVMSTAVSKKFHKLEMKYLNKDNSTNYEANHFRWFYENSYIVSIIV